MKKAMLIYNPTSGKQNFEQKMEYVMNLLKKEFHDVFLCKTEYPNHASELAEQACLEKYDLLVIIGGDGTFNECVNGLMAHDYRPKIGYIPTGTCCDIGLSLGLSKNVKKSMDIIMNNVSAKMDIVKSNDRYFCYVSGNGAFIDISYVTDSKLKRKLGYLAYLIVGVRELFTIPKMRMKIIHDKGEIDGKFSLMLIINSKRVAGVNMIYKPRLDDGLVDVVLYRSIFPLNSLMYLVSLIMPFWSTPFVRRLKTKHLEVITNTKAQWNVDGECGGTGNQLIDVKQQAIEIILPDKIKNRYFLEQQKED